MNIYLVGMMGSGKSVTGKSLATMLNCGFVDLDDLIQDRTKKTIVEIFETQGEAHFRHEESKLLKEVALGGPRVVATGGGTVLNPDNVLRMKETGKVVFLETSIDVLWDRVKNKKNRPLLKSDDPKSTLLKIFSERMPVYESIADFRVPTDGQGPDAVAEKIYEALRNE